MRKLQLFQLIVLILFFVSCEKELDHKTIGLSLTKVSGYVQKGPFLNGTALTISELSADLVPTGKNYPSQILDNKGSFEIRNVELSSQFVEVKADGFYFNEVSNSNSTAQLTLFALSDLTNKVSLNVNVLSTLEKGRVGYLVSNGSNFSDAKKQAQSEILAIFEIEKSAMTESELLDISKTGDDHAILLAISVILQGNFTVSDFSEFLANISTDIREDGVLNSKTLGSALINNSKAIRLDQIRKNLEARYETLGLAVNIPDFEKYVNQFIASTDFEYTSLPVLTTNAVTDIKTKGATCGGNIIKVGTTAITARGICWSTNQNPDTTANKTIDGISGGTFTSTLGGLSTNTTYYVRAYAVNGAGIAYGNEISFTTLESGIGPVSDIDGNVYHTIIIGTQVWMVENLKTTKYRNGDPIPNITQKSEWYTTSGAYCWYDNNINNKADYGALYNWYAVNDIRHLAPEGWHVASNADWTTLSTYLGGELVAGGQLKEAGTTHWKTPNLNATNSSDFTGLPGGSRNDPGDFHSIGYSGSWWCSTETNTDEAWSRRMYFAKNELDVDDRSGKKNGYSVRCVKD